MGIFSGSCSPCAVPSPDSLHQPHPHLPRDLSWHIFISWRDSRGFRAESEPGESPGTTLGCALTQEPPAAHPFLSWHQSFNPGWSAGH